MQYEKYEFLLNKFPDFFDSIILDIGCGNNFLKECLKSKNIKANIIGVDIDGGNVIADANNLPFADECFEKIICIDALHLFEPDLRMLKSGGMILASIFFNDDNFEERKSLLYSRLEGLFVTNELIFKGQEKELFILAKKKVTSPREHRCQAGQGLT